MSDIKTITCETLKEKIQNKEDLILVDVRSPEERAQGSIGGESLPLPELAERFQELDPEKPIALYCAAGRRSAMAAAFLAEKGYKHLLSLQGGVTAWEQTFGEVREMVKPTLVEE